ncbi:MAG: ASKHA domain-containing protein [Thermoplasmata archaeon]
MEKSIPPKIFYLYNPYGEMRDEGMVDCIVTFQPENKSVQVKSGETIMNAAIDAGVFINSVCGGLGKCGKCKVQVKGKVSAKDSELLSKEEKENNFYLACETVVASDVDIYIPEISRAARHQILVKSKETRIEHLVPITRKLRLTLPAPSLEDNISDLERIKKGLAEHNILTARTGVDMLRKVAKILRDNYWDVGVTVSEIDGEYEIIYIDSKETTNKHFGLAIDIGTTTVVVSLIDLNSGETIATKSNYNKQIVCGEDVLARINFAEEEGGLTKLNKLIIETINFLIEELTLDDEVCRRGIKYGTCKEDITSVVAAGNTTMSHLFLSMNPQHIRLEPYIPTASLIPLLKAKDLGLEVNPEATIFYMPCRSSYVGGDVTADILSSGLNKKDELSLLIDVGTNGEAVIGNKEWLVSCSCSAGPAFEGGEVQHGMRAAIGAIEKIALNVLPREKGVGMDIKIFYKTIGDVKPKGICGSGLIDLLAEMFLHGIIDKSGNINDVLSPRIRDGAEGKEFVVVWAKETSLGRDVIAQRRDDGEIVMKEADGKDIVITEADIKNIIRTKGAVYASCSVLLKSLNHTFDDLDKIYIAGGFGNYIDLKNAILLGLFPDVPLKKYEFIGNGSLGGARLALLSKEMREEAKRIYSMMTYIELSVNNMFYNEFTSALFLPHTDMNLFPSVERTLAKTQG